MAVTQAVLHRLSTADVDREVSAIELGGGAMYADVGASHVASR